MRGISIRVSLGLAFLVLTLLPLVGASLFFLGTYEESLRDTVVSNLARIADKKADEIDGYLNERFADIQLLSLEPVIAQSIGRMSRIRAKNGFMSAEYQHESGLLDTRLRGFVERASYYDLLLMDTDGNVVYSVAKESDLATNLLTGPLRNTVLAKGYRQALRFLQSDLTPFAQYAPSGDRPAAFLVAPVLVDGIPIGALALQINADRLEPVVADRTALAATGETVLAQRDGDQVLYTASLRHVENAAYRRRIPFAEAPQPMHLALEGKVGQGLTSDYAGIPVVAAWRYLPSLHWGMVVKMDQSEAFASLAHMKRITFFGLSITLLAVSVLAGYIGRALILPLHRLTQVAADIGRGDLRQRAEESGPLELGQLGTAFNRMGDSLAQLHSGLEIQIEERTCKLRQSEENLRRILDEAPLPIVIEESSQGITFRNQRFIELIGYDEAEMPGISQWWPLAYPDPVYREHIIALWEQTIQDALTQHTIPRSVEAYVACKDGKTRVLDVHLSRIGTQNIVMFADLTDQRLVEGRLKDFLSFSETILLQSPIAMGVFRADGPCVLVNDALKRLTGGTREEMLAQNFRDIDSWRDSGLLDLALDALATLETRRMQIRTVSTFGSILQADVQCVPVTLNGEPHLLAQFLDLTDIHRAAEAMREAKNLAEAASRAKSEFLANMSHEIRTPLNAVIGLSLLLRDTALDPRQRDYLFKILGSSKALLGILNDILDHSKIEAGRLDLEHEIFDLDEVLESVASLFAAPAEEKDIALSFETGDGVPRNLQGDPLRLGQMLNNLVGNAVKFTEKGRIRVKVDLLGQEEDGQGEDRQVQDSALLRFSVEDTGIGISDAQVSRLFQPFTQADGSITRKFGGTGLGLTICKRLAEMMGGGIGVETSPGKGSVFYFTARLALAPANWRSPSRTDLPAPGISSPAGDPWRRADSIRGALVLVAEDNVLNQQVAREFLQRIGLHVELAQNGREAVAMVAGNTYDLVLMDLHMPEMDGLEAARIIRASLGDASPPIVAMTAAAMPQDKEAALDAGMAGHIAKPIDPETLITVLLKWIKPSGPYRKSAAPRPAEPSAPAAPASGASRGFDLDELTQRLGGNGGIIPSLLRTFRGNFAGTAGEIGGFIASGDFEAAARLCHALKGAAGNLSANAVYHASITLEKELKAGTAASFPGFEAALAEALEAGAEKS